PENRMTIAVDDFAILQGASEAPISGAISAKRATPENRQSATARKGWFENGLASAFRLGCSPIKGMRPRRALPAAHFEPNNCYPISGTGH
ncbi:MAG TPA: hypothetical protein VGM62_06290, partial [Chthoniobacterales bacterium]